MKLITKKTRKQALKLAAKGLSSADIAARLGVKKMTVAAWKAHQTMGKYD